MADPNVAFKRAELVSVEPQYTIIDDVIKGSVAVKNKRQEYLPKPNAIDNSIENEARYKAYITRAVFYAVTGRTLRGLVGQIFSREPVIELPTQLKPVQDDTNGEGISLAQLAKKIANDVIAFGRAGLFVDYPATSGQVTQEQLDVDGIRPTITGYSPTQIINWRTRKRGALSVLSLVVLQEKYIKTDDGFEIKKDTQWRVLRLSDDNVYRAEIWRKSDSTSYLPGHVTGVELVESHMPLDASGNPFRDIPFCFVGSENNDSEVDAPPLFDLADLNIAHFRNSADHEENLFLSAQATPVVTGLTEAWADKYFKKGIGLGARAAISLPVGADAKLLQSDERSAIFAEMEHKERQMVALGAKLVEQKTVQRTATEATQEEASEMSILSSISNNLSLAFEWAYGWSALFIGVPETSIKIKFNNEFSLGKMSPAERAQVIKEWQAEAISFSEMRNNLRKTGVATLSDDEAEKEIRDAIPLPNQTGGENNPSPREQFDQIDAKP